MNTQELTKQYSKKIAKLFLPLEVNSENIESHLNDTDVLDRKDIDFIIYIDQELADYAEENSYNAGEDKVNAFVKEHYEECLKSLNFHKEQISENEDEDDDENEEGEIDMTECVETYLFHKEDDSEGEITNADLAYWGIYDDIKEKADATMPKAQKTLDEYWAEVSKLEANGTNKTK